MTNTLPEKRLLFAVLSRAIVDATDLSVDDLENTEWHHKARRWISSHTHIPMSFEWICEAIDLNPEVLRKLILDSTSIGAYTIKNGNGLDMILDAVFSDGDEEYQISHKL